MEYLISNKPSTPLKKSHYSSKGICVRGEVRGLLELTEKGTRASIKTQTRLNKADSLSVMLFNLALEYIT